MDNKPIKEPIRKKWIWIVLVLIVLGNVPWYMPAGSYEPLILGIPYWAWIIVGFSLLLCAYLSWATLKHWNIVEDIEEEEKRRKANE
ncbi:CHASE2 domain-containing sensor protein [Planomicrobium stackebrandtii]|uniref:CHASE2 domain-containing sensor protein n=1 Tax=Planomicrobium stackebrandtii TaxID=253160 RepID=A0ABU0GVW3_9BACL|nr:hypothetical protein [Planomicrobium stackebrandtii]MDQ0429509.1 CHASE2 domain-containing sensor protein [Planomicrobium stackebrandtii]